MTNQNSSIIRPGILVALKSTVSGGVKYQRVDIERAETAAGAALAKWETTRVIEDPAEHDRAVKTRAKALAEVRALCAATSFGLLCPVDREEQLDAALERARELVKAHNETATFTHTAIYVLKGRIASTDEEAARAIGQEISALVASMNDGISKLDVGAIREAASKAQDIAAMLGEDQAKAVASAVEQARRAARQIVKRVQKDGEAAAIVLADIQRGALEKARIAFLDFDGPAAPEAGASEAAPAINVQRVGELELEAPEHQPSVEQ
jgi:hypothetical protein